MIVRFIEYSDLGVSGFLDSIRVVGGGFCQLTVAIEGNHDALIVLSDIAFEDGATAMNLWLEL